MITKEEIEQIRKALNMPEQHGSYEKHHNRAEQILDRLDKIVSSSNVIPDVSERFILVEWLNEIPLVDGSLYFDTKEDLMKHFKALPKIEGVTHTICRIRNAR